jgi:hypothetical protein
MKKILLSLAIGLMGISMFAQNNDGLKLNLEKNKVYRFKSVSEMNISQTINGMTQTTTQDVTYVVSLKMMDSKPDMMVVEFRIDTSLITSNAMGKVTTISSASEGNVKSAEMGEVISSFTNKLSKNPMYFKMDYTGKVIEFVNSKMLGDMIMKDTAQITGDAREMTIIQVKNMINDKSLRDLAETFTHNVPGKAVSKGDTWDISNNVNGGGMSLDFTTTYKLNDLSQGLAKVSAETAIKASDNAPAMHYGPATVTYGGLQGLGKADITLDAATGLLVLNTAKTHIAGDLAVAVQGMNMTMPMQMDGDTKVTAIR